MLTRSGEKSKGQYQPCQGFHLHGSMLFMPVRGEDLRHALRELGLAHQVVCVHSSLRSFGYVSGGAEAVMQAFLDEECTVLVPTFSSAFEITSPSHLQFERNGWNYSNPPIKGRGTNRVYTPEVLDIDRDMGAIPETLVAWPGHVRGNHPLDSFIAIGPRATELVAGQTPLDAYAPLRTLIQLQGFVLLMGVGLERLSLLHLAEKEAGRVLFDSGPTISTGSQWQSKSAVVPRDSADLSSTCVTSCDKPLSVRVAGRCCTRVKP